ncbi:hypothetical protein HDU92_000392 [Lobulomyces angularis]|nr:hypothetical protein HDU92_000392 [Lobulomyces angularis]
MKKAGGTSKDRLAKSGNPKKRTPSNNPVNNSQIGGPGGLNQQNIPTQIGIDELPEQQILIFPEWVEAEIIGEKWNTKHTFDDPEGLIILPKSLRHSVDSWKRPVELTEQVPVGIVNQNSLESIFCQNIPVNTQPNTIPNTAPLSRQGVSDTPGILETPEIFDLGTEPVINVTTEPVITPIKETKEETGQIDAETSAAQNKIESEKNSITASDHVEEQPGSSEQLDPLQNASQLFQHNQHLLVSDLMKNILITIHFLYEHAAKQTRPHTQSSDESLPWDYIFPKSKDGLPSYNVSGKYVVKLHWLGCWRKITVDDKIPVDIEGRPLLVSSPFGEIWPLILSKALLKVASTSFKEQDGCCEYGDFDVINTIRGWLPEKLSVNQHKVNNGLWAIVNGLFLKPSNGSNTAGSNFGNSTAVANQHGSISNLIGNSSASVSQNKSGNTSSTIILNKTEREKSTVPPTAQRPSSIISTSTTATPAASYIFALKDGEENSEKIELNSMQFLYRITDAKENIVLTNQCGNAINFNSNGSIENVGRPSVDEWDYTQVVQRFLKIKSFFACGKQKKTNLVASKLNKEGGLSRVCSGDNLVKEDENEVWISFTEFCRAFRFVTVYHNPTSFKMVKHIQHIVDPLKPSDQLIIIPVLYLPESVKECTVMISLHTYGRCTPDVSNVSSVIVEKWNWDNGIRSTKENNPLIKLTTNSCILSVLKINRGKHAYKFQIDCPSSYQLSIWSKEEFLLEDTPKYLETIGIQVKDIDEISPQQPPNSWCLFVPELIEVYTCLRLFNNDSEKEGLSVEYPLSFFNLKPQLLLPNKNGYTLIADCKMPIQKPQNKWKLRFYSDPFHSPEKLFEGISLKPIVQDFEDLIVPNKHNILFRYIIKIKDGPENRVSMQLSFNLPFVSLNLQLFDHEEEIFSISGKGIVSMHAVTLYANFPEGDGILVPPPQLVENKKGTKDGKDAPKVDLSVKEAVKPPLKHKYILQGSMEPIEWSKFLTTKGNQANDERPVSRGIKTTGSGKKKKSTQPAAQPDPPVITGVASSEPNWKLRFVSTDSVSLIVTKDTEKEDRYRALKDSWELSQPGRALKAKESREQYIKQVEQGLTKPLVFGYTAAKEVCKPWTIVNSKPDKIVELPAYTSTANIQTYSRPTSGKQNKSLSRRGSSMNAESNLNNLPNNALKEESQVNNLVEEAEELMNSLSQQPVLLVNWPTPTSPARVPSAVEVEERVTKRESLFQEYTDFKESVRKERQKDKERRSLIKLHQSLVFEMRQKELETEVKTDIERRENYKANVIKQLEEAVAKKYQLALEQARLAELEAINNPDENEGKDNKKKKAGKAR